MPQATTTPERRSDRAERTHASILRAAAECFATAGYARTSMDEIAERAGITKPTVYAHAGSKGELFTVTLQTVLDQLDELDLTLALSEKLDADIELDPGAYVAEARATFEVPSGR